MSYETPATETQVPRYLLPIMDLDMWAELLMAVEERNIDLRERLAVLTRDEIASPNASDVRTQAMKGLVWRIKMDEALAITLRELKLNPAYDYEAAR